jgi:hypothetical protein
MSDLVQVIFRKDVTVEMCSNEEADRIFIEKYWMSRKRRSRRMSYSVEHMGEKVAWIQCADPFGTKLAKPLQLFDINDAIELARGYFLDKIPCNIESCAIAMVLRRIVYDWYLSFNVLKKIAIVYQDLDIEQRGIVYRALGFKSYGTCKRARYYSKPKHGNSTGNKIIWARALRPVNGMHYKINMPYYPSISNI